MSDNPTIQIEIALNGYILTDPSGSTFVAKTKAELIELLEEAIPDITDPENRA